MATLAALRTKLNAEIGVDTDGATSPWTTAVRNQAISDGYAALWRYGFYKPLTQTISSADDDWFFALTSIRKLYRLEVIDATTSVILDQVPARVEEDGAGGYQLVLSSPIPAGYSMVVRGYGPFKSVFSSDSDTDDIPAEDNRVPLLKAKAILYRAQMGRFAQYGERGTIAPAMNVTVDQLMAIVATAEREFVDECKKAAARRPRVMQSTRVIR